MENPAFKYHRAYSLPEFSIVILVASLIIGTATPAYLHIVENRRIGFAINEMTEMQRDIDRFSRRNNRNPVDLTEIYPAIPVDPWGNTYKYQDISNPQTHPRTDNNLKPVNADYDLYSEGPDIISISPISASESRDDIIRARNGNYIGIATDFRQ